jgi:hypothetical protein
MFCFVEVSKEVSLLTPARDPYVNNIIFYKILFLKQMKICI